jgi:hypothetical protein
MALAAAMEIGGEVHHIPSQECDLDRIKRTVESCYYTPMFNAAQWHHVVIDEADRISKAAQMALLSILDCTAPPPSTIFWFTANATTTLEDRFLSRLRKIKFTTEDLLEPGVKLLKRIWAKEAPAKIRNSPPDFAAILNASNLNLRDALMTLETELLCPGSFECVPVLVPSKSGEPPRAKIYSLGWHNLEVEEVRQIADRFKVDLIVDVFYADKWRKRPEFTRLSKTFGERYTWAGNKLGPKGNTTPAGLDWLESTGAPRKNHYAAMRTGKPCRSLPPPRQDRPTTTGARHHRSASLSTRTDSRRRATACGR